MHWIFRFVFVLIPALLICGCGQETKTTITPPPEPQKPAAEKPAEPVAAEPVTPPADHESLVTESSRNEAAMSMYRGAVYLFSAQKENGSWADHPGITAVCISALSGSDAAATEEGKAAIKKGLAFVRKHIATDGKVKLANAEEDIYSASVCLMALRALDLPEDKERIAAIRGHLITSQIKGNSDFNYGGGLGYKSYPDLSNTHWALEAIRLTRDEEKPSARVQTLWKRSADFIGTCQIKESKDPKRKGGFLYYPIGKEPKNPAHEKTREVWGSLTLGALKSLYYSGVSPEDERMKSGLGWVASNYDLKVNPGLEQGGLYYYYYMLSSAMFFLKINYVATLDGTMHNWRQDLIDVLLSRQRGDGEWRNENRLWLESNKPLCTAYAMKAMQFALRQ